MEWKFAYDGPPEADITFGSGLIEIDATSEAPEGTVAVFLEPFGRDSARATEAIESAEVAFDDGRLRVRVPQRHGRDVPLHLRASLARGAGLRVKCSSADVEVRGELSGLDVKSASGDVAAGDVVGQVHATTASGDLRIGSVTGELRVSSASGDVEALSAAGADIHTASGDIRLESLGAGARIRSASGDVGVGVASQGDLSITTASGDVMVGVADGVGVWLDMTTVTGDTVCELPSEQAQRGEAALVLSLRTVSGDMRIVRTAAVVTPSGGAA